MAVKPCNRTQCGIHLAGMRGMLRASHQKELDTTSKPKVKQTSSPAVDHTASQPVGCTAGVVQGRPLCCQGDYLIVLG